MAKRATRPADPPASIDDRVIEAAMVLAAERGWRRIGLSDIAEAADLPMAALYGQFPHKMAVLAALGRRADIAAAGGARESLGERPRDRLFDVVMRRLEALRPYRAGLRAVVRDLRGDPLAAVAAAPRLGRSLRWMLEAAGLDTAGLSGAARVKALGVAYTATLATWLDDESPDLSATMARLDRMLRRVDGWTRLFGGTGPAREGPMQDDAPSA